MCVWGGVEWGLCVWDWVVNRIKNSIICITRVWQLRISSSEYLVEAGVAVWLVLLLLESALIQLLQAEGADEVFRVEFLEHGRDAASGDGFGAPGAQGSSLGMVVRLAVRQSLVIKEGSSLEGLSAVL